MLRLVVRLIPLLLAVACALAMTSDSGSIQASAPGSSGFGQAGAPAHPQHVLSNGEITVRVLLPDAERGFYRSTRFDWSGVIASLTYRGHEYYAPWFTRMDPTVRDFVFAGADIIASPQSAITGPAEEFPQPQGYADAAPGGTFVKIGVGLLRKPDEARYSPFGAYELVDAGRWTVEGASDRITFTHVFAPAGSDYGYEYRKTLSLPAGRPELVIEHTLRNTGRRPIETTQYNHNFLTLDGGPTGPDLVISVPFELRTPKPIDSDVLTIRGRDISFARELTGEERAYALLQGYGAEAKDFDLRVENRRTGAGVRMTSDRPLAQLALWSIRSVISIEPFVDVSTEPGRTTNWTYTYSYFAR